jgi:hypothetical protein
MIELIYHSEANHNLTPEDISNILKTARDFNFENNITGCLLYHNNEFLQIIEGEREIVQELFASIEKDKRHSSVSLLAKDGKNERMFSGWSMAFDEFNSPEAEKILFRKNIMAFSQLIDKPTHAIDLFLNMAEQIVNN